MVFQLIVLHFIIDPKTKTLPAISSFHGSQPPSHVQQSPHGAGSVGAVSALEPHLHAKAAPTPRKSLGMHLFRCHLSRKSDGRTATRLGVDAREVRL